MPVGINDGEAFDRLHKADKTVLTTDEALSRQRRELHVGIVNMMPDAVLKDTTTHFFLPLHHASGGTIVIPHIIGIEGIERNDDVQEYINQNFITFDQAREEGLDGLIITGANVATDINLRDAPFYNSLKEVIDWAESDEGPTSTLYSCMAGHAYMQIKHEQERKRIPEKQWGVFEHKVRNEIHPLTHGMDTVFDIPHSRWNGISEERFIDTGLKILVASEEAGVHMATSKDGLRSILWQGHPEYRTNSLLKEWKRDFGNAVLKRLDGKQADLPPYPQNYFKGKSLSLIEDFREKVLSGHFDKQLINAGKLQIPRESEIEENIPNRWSSSRRALLGNWLAAIIDKTNYDRKKPFMDGVDPEDVFGLNHKEL